MVTVGPLPHFTPLKQNMLGVSITGLDKQNFERKIVNIFLPISLNICFGYTKEPSHLDGSFEYPQHMFRLRNKKNIFYTHS